MKFFYKDFLLGSGIGELQSKITTLLTDAINLVRNISLPLGILALMILGAQFYFADSHKKSEIKDRMKQVVYATVIVFGASLVVTWVRDVVM